MNGNNTFLARETRFPFKLPFQAEIFLETPRRNENAAFLTRQTRFPFKRPF